MGLIIAGDKKVPRLAAFAYAIGGILGIAFATGIGRFSSGAPWSSGGSRQCRTWRRGLRVPAELALFTFRSCYVSLEVTEARRSVLPG